MSDTVLDLLATPPTPDLSVDEGAVRAGGRRRVRRRNLRRAGLGVAGALGAAALTFGAFGQVRGGGQLEPAAPPSSSSATVSNTVDLLGGGYSVDVIPGAAAGEPRVRFYKLVDGTRTFLGDSDASASVVQLAGVGEPGVMLGTAPAHMAASLTYAPDAKGGIAGDWDTLPGTDYQAIALKFDQPQDISTYRGTFWMDDTGSDIVRDARGTRLPSVQLTDKDTFFIAPDVKVMGVFEGDGGGSLKPLPAGATASFGFGQSTDDGSWHWRNVALLPAGAEHVDFSWTHADQHSAVTLKPVPGTEWVVASADATNAGGTSPLVATVTWTDATGTRHTVKGDGPN